MPTTPKQRWPRLLMPAAAGLMAPLAMDAEPAAAAELNRGAIERYSSQQQLSSIAQLSDLRPSDWAYQALVQLIERYGCVAGTPAATFAGGRPMTRFEAAALLHACLDHVNTLTDDLRRLSREFERELALLRGRVDGLEARAGELEASGFSTTTTLTGMATMVLGGVSNNPNGDQVIVNYDLELTLDTSFTGKDRLRTLLRAGDFDSANSAFGAGLSTLEVGYQEDGGPDVLGIDDLFYQFPIGAHFTATLAARTEQVDMLALWPSAYPSDTVLNLLSLNGAPVAYNKNLGPGFGLWWQNNGWSVSANYVAANAGDASAGLFTGDSAAASTVQVGYGKENWAIAAIYSYLDGGVAVPGATPFVTDAIGSGGSTQAFGISGFWQPLQGGWMPSISAGYGINRSSGSDLRTSQSWLLGLQWSDVLVQGNNAGMGLGQPAFATATRHGAATESGAWAFECWYEWTVSDAISVTPALFVLTDGGDGADQIGALIKTSFRF